jgi:hypothetical protein
VSFRDLSAFVVGAALFALAPVFDAVLPDDRPHAELPVRIALVGAVLVGALVVLIAGEPRAWLLALASAFVASLLSLVHVVAPGPPPPLQEDFGWVYAASGVLYFFAFTGPTAALGGLAAGLALNLVPPLRMRRHPRRSRRG